MKRLVLVMLTGLSLAACRGEDSGVVAAKMEAQDDASCRTLSAGKGAAAYQQCRANLMGYRQQAMAEKQAHNAEMDRRAEGLQAAGAALQAIR